VVHSPSAYIPQRRHLLDAQAVHRLVFVTSTTLICLVLRKVVIRKSLERFVNISTLERTWRRTLVHLFLLHTMAAAFPFYNDFGTFLLTMCFESED